MLARCTPLTSLDSYLSIRYRKPVIVSVRLDRPGSSDSWHINDISSQTALNGLKKPEQKLPRRLNSTKLQKRLNSLQARKKYVFRQKCCPQVTMRLTLTWNPALGRFFKHTIRTWQQYRQTNRRTQSSFRTEQVESGGPTLAESYGSQPRGAALFYWVLGTINWLAWNYVQQLHRNYKVSSKAWSQ